jgi:hypothetical protein
VLENLSQLAIGFADGRVVVVRGQLIKDRNPKQRTVWSSDEAITGKENMRINLRNIAR